jgi:hypothetical protein
MIDTNQMHIEIAFTGHIESIAGQYIATLEQVENWLKINQIESEIGWNDNKMILKLTNLDDYILWLSTSRLQYTIVNRPILDSE